MKLHNIDIGDVACAVHVDHRWSPADIVLVLGTAENNKVRFVIRQIPAVQAILHECASWIAENDPLQTRPSAYGHRKHEN